MMLRIEARRRPENSLHTVIGLGRLLTVIRINGRLMFTRTNHHHFLCVAHAKIRRNPTVARDGTIVQTTNGELLLGRTSQMPTAR